MSLLHSVSVIIPTYNRAPYIKQAIASVLNQEIRDRLVEIIVVDDGSTDGTQNIIQQYKGKIKYIFTDHHGISHARNAGMAASSGSCIAFLDSDDLYYPYKIEMQAACLEQYPDIDLVCTEASAFDNNGYWDEYHLKNYHKPAYSRPDISYESIWAENIPLKEAHLQYGNWKNRNLYTGNIFDAYLQNLIVFTNTVMIRRSILDNVGMQNEQYHLFEEFDFILRCAKHHKAAFIDVPTYKLRYHSDQISNTANKKGLDITIEKQMAMLKIVETHGLKDTGYYLGHKEAMDKRMAVLHKALAIPLMSKRKQSKFARYHLRSCALYGNPDKFLSMLTYFPYVIRRIVLKIRSLISSR